MEFKEAYTENAAIVQCQICTAKFCNKYDLKLHIAEHKSKCEICGGNYGFIDWHKKSVHGINKLK